MALVRSRALATASIRRTSFWKSAFSVRVVGLHRSTRSLNGIRHRWARMISRPPRRKGRAVWKSATATITLGVRTAGRKFATPTRPRRCPERSGPAQGERVHARGVCVRPETAVGRVRRQSGCARAYTRRLGIAPSGSGRIGSAGATCAAAISRSAANVTGVASVVAGAASRRRRRSATPRPRHRRARFVFSVATYARSTGARRCAVASLTCDRIRRPREPRAVQRFEVPPVLSLTATDEPPSDPTRVVVAITRSGPVRGAQSDPAGGAGTEPGHDLSAHHDRKPYESGPEMPLPYVDGLTLPVQDDVVARLVELNQTRAGGTWPKKPLAAGDRAA